MGAEVDGLYDLSRDSVMFGYFVWTSFGCGRTCPGFKSTKVFTLDVERGRVWEPESVTFFGLDIIAFVSNFPSIEEVKLPGVPSPELSSILDFLRTAARFKLPCPKLRRLDIESIPLRSPRPLLFELDKLLAERKEAGASFRSVMVKVKCDVLIPPPEHYALLTSWWGFVEEDDLGDDHVGWVGWSESWLATVGEMGEQ